MPTGLSLDVCLHLKETNNWKKEQKVQTNSSDKQLFLKKKKTEKIVTVQKTTAQLKLRAITSVGVIFFF